MVSKPYTGFEPMQPAAMRALEGGGAALAEAVRVAERFMEQEVPLMAVAAGLLPNVHRRVVRETAEEGAGLLPHRIFVPKRPHASFVVMPVHLQPVDAEQFMAEVGPAGEHLVIAATSYEPPEPGAPGFRAELEQRWGKPLTLLTFAGTESKHGYEVYEGE